MHGARRASPSTRYVLSTSDVEEPERSTIPFFQALPVRRIYIQTGMVLGVNVGKYANPMQCL